MTKPQSTPKPAPPQIQRLMALPLGGGGYAPILEFDRSKTDAAGAPVYGATSTQIRDLIAARIGEGARTITVYGVVIQLGLYGAFKAE